MSALMFALRRVDLIPCLATVPTYLPPVGQLGLGNQSDRQNGRISNPLLAYNPFVHEQWSFTLAGTLVQNEGGLLYQWLIACVR